MNYIIGQVIKQLTSYFAFRLSRANILSFKHMLKAYH